MDLKVQQNGEVRETDIYLLMRSDDTQDRVKEGSRYLHEVPPTALHNTKKTKKRNNCSCRREEKQKAALRNYSDDSISSAIRFAAC
jgi:hypothetical protein